MQQKISNLVSLANNTALGNEKFKKGIITAQYDRYSIEFTLVLINKCLVNAAHMKGLPFFLSLSIAINPIPF